MKPRVISWFNEPNLLIKLLGELDDLRGQRHAGLHHHQVAGAGCVAMPLGNLGGPLPQLVLDRHVGAVLHQSLDKHTNTSSGAQMSPFWFLLHRQQSRPAAAYLDTGEMSVLSRHVDGRVSVLVDLVQGDGLLLHELEQPQQNLLLRRNTDDNRSAPVALHPTATRGQRRIKQLVSSHEEQLLPV